MLHAFENFRSSVIAVCSLRWENKRATDSFNTCNATDPVIVRLRSSVSLHTLEELVAFHFANEILTYMQNQISYLKDDLLQKRVLL